METVSNIMAMIFKVSISVLSLALLIFGAISITSAFFSKIDN